MGLTFDGDVVGVQTKYKDQIEVLAATATESHVLYVTPYRMRLNAVRVIARAAVTGDDTDRKNFNIINRGVDGSGSAELAALDLATGVDLVAFDQKTIASGLSVDLPTGTVIAVEYEKIGSGVLIPDVTFEIDVTSSELAQTS